MSSPLVLSPGVSPSRGCLYYSPKKGFTDMTPRKQLAFSRSTTGTSQGSTFKSCLKSTGKFSSTHRSTTEVQDLTDKAELYESKIRQIDIKITDSHNHDEEKFKSYAEKVFELEENIAANIIAVEFLEERRVKEISLVESTATLDLKNEAQSIKQAQERILSNIIKEVKSIKSDFMIEQTKKQDYKDKQTETISNQIAEIKQGLEKEQTIREQAQENIVQVIGDRLSQIQENIVRGRKTQRATHTFFSEKIDEISKDLQQQIVTERLRRERTESLMIELLEASCGRFESQVGNRKRRF